MTENHAREILIVDDEILNIRLLTAILSAVAQQAGISVNVVSATNGKDALLMAKTNRLDMILLDVMMSDMDGYEVCQALKSDPATSAIPIIFATGMNDGTETDQGIKLGAVDYLYKPFDAENIATTVLKWLLSDAATGDQSAPSSEADDAVQNAFPEDMSGIDVENGLKRVLGNIKLYKRILIQFHEAKGNVVAELGAALTAGDNEMLGNLAHGLKGLAGNIGATDVFKAASDVELAVKEGRHGELRALVDVLLRNFVQVQKTLRNLSQRETTNAATACCDSQNPGDVERARPLVTELRSRLSLNDMSADKLIVPIRELLTDKEFSGEIDELESRMSKLDFAGALVSLGSLTGLMQV